MIGAEYGPVKRLWDMRNKSRILLSNVGILARPRYIVRHGQENYYLRKSVKVCKVNEVIAKG